MRAYDLAVVGGGPAGCTAATLAARLGFRVLLLERGASRREKVCGEFLAPEAVPLVRDLVEGTPGEAPIAAAIPIRQAHLHLGEEAIDFALEPPALGVPRRVLDSALWEAAVWEGADALERTEVLAVHGREPFLLETNRGVFLSRALLNASGRWSRLTGRRAPSDWIGIKAHVRERDPDPGVHLYFFDGGYCGAQPAGEGLVAVAAAVRGRADLEEVVERHPALAARGRGWTLEGRAIATAPLDFGRRPAPPEGWLAIGDAAGFIDPFLGQGMATAILGAREAVEALRPGLAGLGDLGRIAERWRRRHAEATRPAFALAGLARRLLALPLPLRRTVLGLIARSERAPAALDRVRALAALSPA